MMKKSIFLISFSIFSLLGSCVSPMSNSHKLVPLEKNDPISTEQISLRFLLQKMYPPKVEDLSVQYFLDMLLEIDEIRKESPQELKSSMIQLQKTLNQFTDKLVDLENFDEKAAIEKLTQLFGENYFASNLREPHMIDEYLCKQQAAYHEALPKFYNQKAIIEKNDDYKKLGELSKELETISISYQNKLTETIEKFDPKIIAPVLIELFKTLAEVFCNLDPMAFIIEPNVQKQIEDTTKVLSILKDFIQQLDQVKTTDDVVAALENFSNLSKQSVAQTNKEIQDFDRPV